MGIIELVANINDALRTIYIEPKHN